MCRGGEVFVLDLRIGGNMVDSLNNRISRPTYALDLGKLGLSRWFNFWEPNGSPFDV